MAYLIIILGLILLFAATWKYRDWCKITESWGRTLGVIVDQKHSSSVGGGFLPVVEFNDATGKTVVFFEQSVNRQSIGGEAWLIGEKVTVCFDPAEREQPFVYSHGNVMGLCASLTALGLICVVAGGLLMGK
jgi:Protein of unknown function (DUF3592)